MLGDERDPTPIVAAVQAGYAAARDSGIGGRDGGTALGVIEAAFREANLEVLDELADLERVSELTWPEKLNLIAIGEHRDLKAIMTYLGWADTVLLEATERAQALLGGAEEEGETATSITADLLAVLRDVSANLEAAAQ